MGTWGSGLYSDDYALDLRASIAALCRLPHSGDAIVDLLAELNPEAHDPDDDCHTTFWLVVADQLHRRGIRSQAQERALEIIANQTNLAALAKLDMAAEDLEERQRSLSALGDELRSPTAEKSRKTLKKPQPLLFGAGDVLVFPIDSRGNCYNPYMKNPALARFTPVGWDGCMVVASGRALEYLTWYQIAPTRDPWTNRPTLAEVVARIDPAQARVGTLSKVHVARMALELLGPSVPPKVDPPTKRLVVRTTARDISASNILNRWLAPGTVK
jgi:hypothetical protein